MTDHRKEALGWLRELQKGNDAYGIIMAHIEVHARLGGFPLRAIVSDQELEKLRLKSCRAKARLWLDRMREGSRDMYSYELCLGNFLQAAKAGKFQFYQLGTTQAELDKLAAQAGHGKPVPDRQSIFKD